MGVVLGYGLQMTLERMTASMEAKLKTIGDFRVHERDTGSADVQIALLTRRINHLTEHLQKNAKDHSSRRGLLMMVGQRRRLLDYLQSIDAQRYQALTRKLNLRR
jgi:small subunit ribosomal protein S15